MKPCYVYIIGHAHPKHGFAVKVGIADLPGSRLATLQTGSCEELSLYFTAKLDSRRRALLVEQTFHEYFADRRIRGEWFAFSPGHAMFMLGNVLAAIARAAWPDPDDFDDAKDEIGIPDAFAPFDDEDYDTRADWVNDWALREEARLLVS